MNCRHVAIRGRKLHSLAIGCVLLWAAQAVGAGGTRPNIVFILADDLGYGEVGCYGQDKIRTPHIDALAGAGMRFSQHYTGAPVCAPARCVLMTGRHLAHAEIRGNRDSGNGRRFPGQWPITSEALTIAEVLKDAGYATGGFGKWGLGPSDTSGSPNQQGFDRFYGYNCQRNAHSYYPPFLDSDKEEQVLNPDPVPGHQKQPEGEVKADDYRARVYAPDRILEEALAFLDKNKDRPFFLYLPFVEPHVAMQPPQEWIDRYPQAWDEEHGPYRGQNAYLPHPRPRAAYAAMISDLDEHVGAILNRLEQLGLADNTLVVFTSDNGPTHPGNDPRWHIGGAACTFFKSTGGLKGYKGSAYEGGIRVPCVVRWPGQVEPGSVCSVPGYFPDWFPTLCTVAGADLPETGLDGIDLSGVLRGRAAPERAGPMIWEFHGYGGIIAIRDGKWKALRRGLHGRKGGPVPWELYDLDRDSGEKDDLASRHPDVVRRLEATWLATRRVEPDFPLKLVDDKPTMTGPADSNVEPGDDTRMAWWRDARFGLFIHWGLYAIPAGEWKDRTNHGEWIMTTGQIPVEDYEPFVDRFNPVDFDADAWVRMAKQAGMKYIVITSKHHDGFCLFDSAHTEYDIMSTPFKRDIMKELAEACRKEGLRICWYHSIMDWHHPDYLPRRSWEKRDAEGADFDRYVDYMKRQVAELLTGYGDIGVMWFDGEWEHTWNHAYGTDLYEHVRALQPRTIINNRVDVGRRGMEGMSKPGEYLGDFGTPEQQIPATGVPGVDWETCMTMNRHWGYNRHDQDWKSTEDLIRKLADIASKGGNFLLNVGPTAEGRFPEASIERLEAIGRWMAVNGESIHGTQASPFPQLEWGRCTAREGRDGTWRLYLHVFDWPENGVLEVPTLDNAVRSVRLLARAGDGGLPFESKDGRLLLTVPQASPDPVDTVIVVEISGKPVAMAPPAIEAASAMFTSTLDVTLSTDVRNAAIRYTLDGTPPTSSSSLYRAPLTLDASSTVRAQLFRDGDALTEEARRAFERVTPRPAGPSSGLEPGLAYAYYEGNWTELPAFDALEPAVVGTASAIDLAPARRAENFGLHFTGFVEIPAEGVYTFSTDSDDGSRLLIGDRLIVDNDGLHSVEQVSGSIALAKGAHPITVLYFQGSGGRELNVGVSGPGLDHRALPDNWLFHR